MKTTSLLTLAFAAALLCWNVEAVNAQSSLDLSNASSPSSNLHTTIALNVNSATGPSISTDEVRSIHSGSMHKMIADQLASLSVTNIAEKLQGTFESLTNGKPVGFISKLSANNTISGQNIVKVKVNFETRPIGGIITVRVDLVPIFPGIGAASRPAASLERAEAVENLDEDVVNDIVAKLTHELGVEYRTR